MVSGAPLDGPFSQVWPQAFDTLVGAQDAFDYVLDRTLMRPRDVLSLLQRALEVALNRGHERVEQDDIKRAEASYSEDQLEALVGEIHDVYPQSRDVVYELLGCRAVMGEAELDGLLRRVVPDEGTRARLVDLLLWYCLLGVIQPGSGAEKYAYQDIKFGTT
jgi:hypothetical protein